MNICFVHRLRRFTQILISAFPSCLCAFVRKNIVFLIHRLHRFTQIRFRNLIHRLHRFTQIRFWNLIHRLHRFTQIRFWNLSRRLSQIFKIKICGNLCNLWTKSPTPNLKC